MRYIVKNKTDRFAFQFGVRSTLRSTNELIDQLQDQLRSERVNLAEKERELAITLRELAEVRYKLALIEAFAVMSSPSASLH